MPSVDSFWRRHFALSSPLTIILSGGVIAVVVGLVGATIWTGSESAEVRRAGSSPSSNALPTETVPEIETTTTKPDLSMESIDTKISPFAWALSTLDQSGRPSQASAFVVGVSGRQTFLITSLAAVEAATRNPAPEITAQNGTFNGPAILWTWDEEHDLALLAVNRPRAESLEWAANNNAAKAGDRIFAVSSDPDNRVTPGVLTRTTSSVLEHNIFIDDARRGGPIVNIKGEVIAMSSAAFTGGGDPTDSTFFSVPIRELCATLIHCAGTNPPQAGTPDAPSTTEG
ncbi:MAG TPA: trypsin-like peptidase domain-containing protein [Acidimicrobiales bacterium]|nr:trypsin-like peptidase domain-containing protein [Acidimicrobiales bacterium]